MLTRRFSPVNQVALFCLATLALAACEERDSPSEMKSRLEPSDSLEDTETSADTNELPSTDTDADSESEPEKEARGDLADFPVDSDCLATCHSACARVKECGGEQSRDFPLPPEEKCAERCIRALSGPMWDDATVSFRCCAAQQECAEVKTCGGWLAHPSAAAPCATLCKCMFGGADTASVWSGLTAPDGYALARDAVAVAMEDHTTAFEMAYGARVHSLGRLAFLDLSHPMTAGTLDELMEQEILVPTFRDAAGRLSAATNTLVARANTPEALAVLSRAASGLGLTAPRQAHDSSNLYLLEGRDPWQATALRPALEVRIDSDVELSMVRIYEKRWTPNDPLFGQQWHLLNTGQGGIAVPGVDSRVSEAWELTQGSSETIIAILDDGVDIEHPDLASNVVGSTNFPDDWRDQMAVGSFGWHGTSCAGVAAARGDNAEGVSGVCPNCSLHGALLGGAAGLSPGPGMQVTDEEMANLFIALVDAGAAVISNSWGLEGEDPRVENPSVGSPSLSSLVRAAFDYAETDGRDGKGTVVVFAAGNSNQDVGRDPYSSYKNIVAVAAVDDQGLKSYYSNYGKEIHIAAPSNGGLLGIVTTASDVGGDLQQDPAYTANFGGTSSACPFVAGVVGLIISANPELSASQVRRALADSGRKIDPIHARYRDNGHSYFYGYGLVDAYRAVRLAQTIGTNECTADDSCRAPSDAPCGSGCEKSGSCTFCRTDMDCAAGKCQALPELGRLVCVSEKSGAACPSGYEEVGGYCLPTRLTCDLCDELEACDGRDNDCNGVWDETEDCSGNRCHQEMRGCDEGQGCAGVHCSTTCQSDDDCDSGRCKAVKDRYGAIHSDVKICYGGSGSCVEICQAIASSNDDEGLQGFLDCMAPDTCEAAYGCISKM